MKERIIKFTKLSKRITISCLAGLIVLLAILSVIYSKNNFHTQSLPSAINIEQPAGYSSEIEAYVKFLESAPRTDPADYVLNLFKNYDIVVIGERGHPEITQYDLIYKIVSDKRFIEYSGKVCLEVATQSINDRLNTFLHTGGLKEKEVDTRLIKIYRDIYRTPYWEKYNLYDFLRKIYFLNDSLADNKKISVYGTDTPVNWEDVSKPFFVKDIDMKENIRDETIAEFIYNRYAGSNSGSDKRNKLLVILNTVHSFKTIEGTSTQRLNLKLPGKVANVMLNTILPLVGTDNNMDATNKNASVQDGKWDAAFRYVKNPNIAFDFKNTPFGKDYFDLADNFKNRFLHIYPGLNRNAENNYADAYDGFIFYYPLEKHRYVWRIPGFLDADFLPVFNLRIKTFFPDTKSLKAAEATYEEFNSKQEMFYPDILRYNKEIEKWLTY